MKNFIVIILLLLATISIFAMEIVSIAPAGFPIVVLKLSGTNEVPAIKENGDSVEILKAEKIQNELIITYVSNTPLDNEEAIVKVEDKEMSYNIPSFKKSTLPLLSIDEGKTINIDASYNDWANISGVRLSKKFSTTRGKEIAGDSDLSAVLKSAKDENNYYFLVIVNDDVPLPSPNYELMEYGDAVILSLDDHEFYIIPGNFLTQEASIYKSDGSFIEGAKVKSKLKKGYYIYELSIKREILDSFEKVSIEIIDNDASQKENFSTLKYTGIISDISYNPPVIHVESPRDGVTFSKPYLFISGYVEGKDVSDISVNHEKVTSDGETLPQEVITLSLDNGNSFTHNLLLVSGENKITVSATNLAGRTSKTINVLYPKDNALQFLIKWDDNTADLDLYVTLPDGEIMYFMNSETPGKLTTDNQSGFELYEIPFSEIKEGLYHPRVHIFSGSNEKEIIDCEFIVRWNFPGEESREKIVFQENFQFKSIDANQENTSPGATGKDWKTFNPVRILKPEVPLYIETNLPEELEPDIYFQVNNIEYTNSFCGQYPLGTKINATIYPRSFRIEESTRIEGEDTEYKFSSWKNLGTSANVDVKLNSPTTIEAVYEKSFKVVVRRIDENGKQIGEDSTYWVKENNSIEICADEIGDLLFSGWTLNGVESQTKSLCANFTITRPTVIEMHYLGTGDVALIDVRKFNQDLDAAHSFFEELGFSVTRLSLETLKENSSIVKSFEILFFGFSGASRLDTKELFDSDIRQLINSFLTSEGLMLLSGSGVYLTELIGLTTTEDQIIGSETLEIPSRPLYDPDNFFSELIFTSADFLLNEKPANETLTDDSLWVTNDEQKSIAINNFVVKNLPIHFIETVKYGEGEILKKTHPVLLWNIGSSRILYIEGLFSGKDSLESTGIKFSKQVIKSTLTEKTTPLLVTPILDAAVHSENIVQLMVGKDSVAFYEIWGETNANEFKYIDTVYGREIIEIDYEPDFKGYYVRTLSNLYVSELSNKKEVNVPMKIDYKVSENVVEAFLEDGKKWIKEFKDTEVITPLEFDFNRNKIKDILLVRRIDRSTISISQSNLILTALSANNSVIWERVIGERRIYAIYPNYILEKIIKFENKDRTYFTLIANCYDQENKEILSSVVTVIDESGTITGELWHPGPFNIAELEDYNSDGKREFIFAGRNIHTKGADYIIISVDDLVNNFVQTSPGKGSFFPVTEGNKYMIYPEYNEFVDVEFLSDGKGVKFITENNEIIVR
ncbi:MAG: hypothetical protein R6U52_10830 [Kosmotogaceae bacterium]